MRWVLRLVETGDDARSRSADLMEICRPEGLREIADLGRACPRRSGSVRSCADCKASSFFIVLLMTRPSRGGRCGLLEGSDGDERWLVRFGGSGNWRAGGSGVHHDIGKSEPPS